jgi:hypothetical protein
VSKGFLLGGLVLLLRELLSVCGVRRIHHQHRPPLQVLDSPSMSFESCSPNRQMHNLAQPPTFRSGDGISFNQKMGFFHMNK